MLLLVALVAATFATQGRGESPASVAGNFIVTGVDPERALAIAEHAESLRQLAFVQLLERDTPEAWTPACIIHVHASPSGFAAALGGLPLDARGATSIDFAGDRVASRRIDVLGNGPDTIPDALDHELVHVVLADHFVAGPPPRWADEGLALLFDAPSKQHRHDADLREAVRQGLIWSTADLVALEDYPDEASRQRIFYGQSAAAVRWLVGRRDAATFVRFLDDVAVLGIEPALARHYDLGSLAMLSSAWKEVAPISSLGLSDPARPRLP